MLHYSNASSIEKNRRYLVIKGGACLVALASRRGRQLCSRTRQQQRQSRSLPERRGGRNSKYNANISTTRHNMAKRSGRSVLTQCYTILAKGDNIRKVFPELGIFGQMKRSGNVASSIG